MRYIFFKQLFKKHKQQHIYTFHFQPDSDISYARHNNSWEREQKISHSHEILTGYVAFGTLQFQYIHFRYMFFRYSQFRLRYINVNFGTSIFVSSTFQLVNKHFAYSTAKFHARGMSWRCPYKPLSRSDDS